MEPRRHSGGCRKKNCVCHQAGSPCEEFMGNNTTTYCARCGWSREGHWSADQIEKVREMLRSAATASEVAQARYAAPYSSDDARNYFHERRGIYIGVGMVLEQLLADKP